MGDIGRPLVERPIIVEPIPELWPEPEPVREPVPA